MANPFRYRKTRHNRTRSPSFRRYQQYKPDLRIEFAGQCVYCRALDHVKGVDEFGVDHYRPQSHPLFANLAAEYFNLYYACNRCNRLKRDYWPETADERAHRFIPNPCEHIMFEHLRYKRGTVDSASTCGEFTIRRLDLNERETVQFREGFLAMLARLTADMAENHRLLEEANKQYRRATSETKRNDIQAAIDLTQTAKNQLNRELEQALGPLALAALAQP